MREEELRQQLLELKNSTLDDGLDIRKNVCEQIRLAVEASLDRLRIEQTQENPKEGSATSGTMDNRVTR